MSQVGDAPNGERALRLRYIVTICAGSFLLFLVQPMVARMALPRLGGAPTVWNSAMVVYQALLLGGYAYAHWLGRFSGRTQAAIHLFLFVAAALTLPVGLTSSLPSADANPVFWVPYLLLTSIGPVFFVIAAQAPLMQRWFSLSGGGDPYPLYARIREQGVLELAGGVHPDVLDAAHEVVDEQGAALDVELGEDALDPRAEGIEGRLDRREALAQRGGREHDHDLALARAAAADQEHEGEWRESTHGGGANSANLAEGSPPQVSRGRKSDEA